MGNKCFSPPLNEVLEFLLMLNVALSALSTIIQVEEKSLGQYCLVIQFLKAVFNQGPALPKTEVTWDVDLVFRYLKSLATEIDHVASAFGRAAREIHLFVRCYEHVT